MVAALGASALADKPPVAPRSRTLGELKGPGGGVQDRSNADWLRRPSNRWRIQGESAIETVCHIRSSGARDSREGRTHM